MKREVSSLLANCTDVLDCEEAFLSLLEKAYLHPPYDRRQLRPNWQNGTLPAVYYVVSVVSTIGYGRAHPLAAGGTGGWAMGGV